MARDIYVPMATAALVLAVSFAPATHRFDPLTAAQNPRLSFYVRAETVAGGLASVGGLWVNPEDGKSRVFQPMPENDPDGLSVLYIGNSQIMAIMDLQPGDHLAQFWLDHYLNGQSESSAPPYAVRTAPDANLTMSEALIKVVQAAADGSRRPDVIVFGIVLDGLRWIEPREEYRRRARRPDVAAELDALISASPDLTMATKVIRGILAIEAAAASPASPAVPTRPPGEHANDRVERWLARRVPLFARRSDMRAELLTAYRTARNRLFVRSDTRRTISQPFFRTNLELIEMMMRFLEAKNVNFVVYIAPIRPIYPTPYDPANVQDFKRELPAIGQEYRAVTFDYSDVVPESMWTQFPEGQFSGLGGQPDFAHFTGRGHQRLGERLARDLKPLLAHWLAEKRGTARVAPRVSAQTADR